MKDARDNIVKFQPRRPEPPKKAPKTAPQTAWSQKAWLQPGPKPYQANRYGGTEPAIRWNKAPKALVIIVLIMVAMALVSGLTNWVSSIGS